MSEAHTPGLLAVATDGSVGTIVSADTGIQIAQAQQVRTMREDLYQHERRANARRIAATWNACSGLPTDVLEREPYIGMASYTMRMQAERERDQFRELARANAESLGDALRERDAALAALADANALLKAQRAWIHAIPQDTQLPTMPGFDGDWADDVMAKVAKATGGAA